MADLTRRTWLKEVGAAGAGAMIGGGAAPQGQSNGAILPLTSTSDVFIPPRGRGFRSSASTSLSRQSPSTATSSGSACSRTRTPTACRRTHLIVRTVDRRTRACLHGTDLGGRAAAVAGTRDRAADEARRRRRMRRRRGDGAVRSKRWRWSCAASRADVCRPAARRSSIRATTRCCWDTRSRAAISSARRATAA